MDDDVHKMDAFSRNECEKQFLKAINYLQKYLGCKISIDVQVKKEGGVIDTYQVICAEILTNPSVTFVFGAVFNAFINNFFRPNIHSSEETKNNLENIEKTKQLIESGTITSENFESIFANDRYIKKRKSIFLKKHKKSRISNKLQLNHPNYKHLLQFRFLILMIMLQLIYLIR